MNEPLNIAEWVQNESYRGHFIFTRQDIDRVFPLLSPTRIVQALWELSERGILYSPWQNFYIIVPTEYRLKGVVPPVFFIDQLMDFLGRPYYIGLLNAGAFYGAAHQRPQTFSCIVGGGSIRSISRKGITMLFHHKANMPMEFTQQFKTQMGYVNVSSPCLTALDLILFEQEIGGLSRAATVLAELTPELHFAEQPAELLRCFNAPIIQRLGYILECVLEEQQSADELYALAKIANMSFRKVRLKISKPETDQLNRRWKIIDNQPIEIDDIINMADKMQDDEFLNDTEHFLRFGDTFDPQAAYELVREKLIDRLQK